MIKSKNCELRLNRLSRRSFSFAFNDDNRLFYTTPPLNVTFHTYLDKN